MQGAVDPVDLARRLIACRSVTPADDGAQDVVADALAGLGFEITRLPFGRTPNLWARIGAGRPHVCFAGHTDVVPAGVDGWSVDPFAGEISGGKVFGRGACDMKGAIASFVAAVADVLAGGLARGLARGSISLLITGDEEGPARDGTTRVVDWLRACGQMPDFCLVGEPTNATALGQSIKIGRRGSLNATIALAGRQGHVAYPDRARNPVHPLVALLAALVATRLDGGTEAFAPSSLQVTSVDVGNPATNVIPASAHARLNIRFNERHTGSGLTAWLAEMAGRHAPGAVVEVSIGGEPFLTATCGETEALRRVVERVTGVAPALSTGGGTSDARFLAPWCRVAEFGLVGASMHEVDEHVTIEDLQMLRRIYRDWLVELVS